MPAPYDVEFLGSQFGLELDKTEVARFSGCSGLSWTAEVVTSQFTEKATKRLRTVKRPGRISYDDIVLKRGLSKDPSLTDWCKLVTEGKAQRRNGAIVVYDSAGNEQDRWSFEDGWPSKWSASDLDAGSDDVMIEELTITHELLKRGKP